MSNYTDTLIGGYPDVLVGVLGMALAVSIAYILTRMVTIIVNKYWFRFLIWERRLLKRLFDKGHPYYKDAPQMIRRNEMRKACVTVEDYEKMLKELKDVAEIQCKDGNWDWDAYMHGMANGLILAVSIFTGEEPDYKKSPDSWLRHAPDSWLRHDLRKSEGK